MTPDSKDNSEEALVIQTNRFRDDQNNSDTLADMAEPNLDTNENEKEWML